MRQHAKRSPEAGFSLIELTVTMGIMVAILGVTAGLMADALRAATVTSETTDAQQALRSAHEYISRDLLVVGDGLGGLDASRIRLPLDFVQANITPDPNGVATLNRGAGGTIQYVPLPLVTADDAQTRAGAAATLLAGADRFTMMTIQPDVGFPVTVLGATPGVLTQPDPNTLIANVQGATAQLFQAGEVVLVTSAASGVSAFAAVTGVVTGGGSQLRFAAADPYGLNTPNLPLLLDVFCGPNTPALGGCNNVTVQRVLLITYFVDQNGLLRRRVLGKPRRGAVGEAAFAANAMAGDVVSEHVTELVVRYGLVAPDRSDWDIVDRMTPDEQARVRQVEVKLTAETPHAVLRDGTHGTATSVVRTSVRTMEYRNAL